MLQKLLKLWCIFTLMFVHLNSYGTIIAHFDPNPELGVLGVHNRDDDLRAQTFTASTTGYS